MLDNFANDSLNWRVVRHNKGMEIEAAKMNLRVGTRGSLLARTQTESVLALLRAARPGLAVTTEIIQTTGDQRRDVPFAAVGTKGMFVKEIEDALLEGRIEVGVHSLKDMPGILPKGLTLAAYPAREDARDALISRDGATLAELPQGATVGTSSARRQALLRAFRPDLHLVELRGNLDTRLRKLDEGQCDAIVLACAGLHRLGMDARITERIAPEICLPPPGQGALALETRRDDYETLALLAPLNDVDTIAAVTAERAFQAAIGGGCTVPVGAWAALHGDILILQAVIASPDGSQVVRHTETGTRDEAEQIGKNVARFLLEAGGARLMRDDEAHFKHEG